MNQKIEPSDVETFPGVESVTFSMNEARIVVVGEGMLDDATGFLLNHGYAASDIRQEGDQVRVEFRLITEF